MTDKALEIAKRNRDSLAAEINSLAQRIDDLKRDLAKIDGHLEKYSLEAGRSAIEVAAVSV